jgi:hypothetical protein
VSIWLGRLSREEQGRSVTGGITACSDLLGNISAVWNGSSSLEHLHVLHVVNLQLADL